jgi:hypothetical protein
VQSSALFFSLCWLFTNVVVLNLVIALVLEQFRLKDSVKLGIQRKEVLKAAHTTHVTSPPPSPPYPTDEVRKRNLQWRSRHQPVIVVP